MRRMLTAKLQNRSGVLNRFTGVLSRRQITIQMTGDAEKSEALLRVIRPYGIRNIARTGATGFTRD